MIVHEYTDEPVCPYCGHEQGDSFEMSDDSVYDCSKCGKHFKLNDHVSRMFTTYKLPCRDGEAEHNWRRIGSPPVARECRLCTKYEREP